MAQNEGLGIAPIDEPTTAPSASTMESVSSSLDVETARLLRQRAEEEDRTIAVVIRRAVKAYMKGWTPGQDDED